ncbi:amidase domain-containing protein [Paenibacillus chitinolyticus]|uniref:amidase domain-containing protein n=1 Tax=Paenibacillus chitinolyticus TaxID=79263 RepID=UPI00386EC313
MSWKTALYDYLHARNTAETEASAGVLANVVEDERFSRETDARYHRLIESRKERGVKALRGEMRLKLQHVHEHEEGVTADVECQQQFFYEQGGRERKECIVIRERVGLIRKGSRWIIAQISARESEREKTRQSYSWLAEEGIYTPEGEISSSQPYLNYSILNHVGTYPETRKKLYDRGKAVKYADTWWNRYNPAFIEFEVDCTSYVSQCLFAGGTPMNYTGKRGAGWWYAGKQGGRELWSYSWAVAQALQLYVPASRRGLSGTLVSSAAELRPGDFISYDWDGDGRFQHNTFVTALDASGMPLVNAHTVSSKHRYWDYKDSYAWTDKTRYAFVRVSDEMDG